MGNYSGYVDRGYSCYGTNFYTIRNNVSADITTLNTLKGSYDTAISDATTSLSGASFEGWEDEIQRKIEASSIELSSAISAINTDITSGNFALLIKKMGELKSALDSCVNVKYYMSQNGLSPYSQGHDEEHIKAVQEALGQLGYYDYKRQTAVNAIEAIVFNATATEAPDLGDGFSDDEETEQPFDGFPEDSIQFSSTFTGVDFSSGEEGESRTLPDGSEMIIESRTVNPDGSITETGTIISDDGNEYQYTAVIRGEHFDYEVTYDGHVVYTETGVSFVAQFTHSTRTMTDYSEGTTTVESTHQGYTSTYTTSTTDPANYEYVDGMTGDRYVGYRGEDGTPYEVVYGPDGSVQSGPTDVSGYTTQVTVTHDDGTVDTYTYPEASEAGESILGIILNGEMDDAHDVNDAGWRDRVDTLLDEGTGEFGGSTVTLDYKEPSAEDTLKDIRLAIANTENTYGDWAQIPPQVQADLDNLYASAGQYEAQLGLTGTDGQTAVQSDYLDGALGSLDQYSQDYGSRDAEVTIRVGEDSYLNVRFKEGSDQVMTYSLEEGWTTYENVDALKDALSARVDTPEVAAAVEQAPATSQVTHELSSQFSGDSSLAEVGLNCAGSETRGDTTYIGYEVPWSQNNLVVGFDNTTGKYTYTLYDSNNNVVATQENCDSWGNSEITTFITSNDPSLSQPATQTTDSATTSAADTAAASTPATTDTSTTTQSADTTTQTTSGGQLKGIDLVQAYIDNGCKYDIHWGYGPLSEQGAWDLIVRTCRENGIIIVPKSQ